MAVVTLVTLAQAKEHLRIDQDIMDADITLKLIAAEARVRRHIVGTEISALEEMDLELIKAAILVLLGTLDMQRASENTSGSDRDWLPAQVHQLLKPFRTPGVG